MSAGNPTVLEAVVRLVHGNVLVVVLHRHVVGVGQVEVDRRGRLIAGHQRSPMQGDVGNAILKRSGYLRRRNQECPLGSLALIRVCATGLMVPVNGAPSHADAAAVSPVTERSLVRPGGTLNCERPVDWSES